MAAGVMVRRRVVWIVIGFVLAGALSGSMAAARMGATQTAPVPEGRITITARVAEDSNGADRPAIVEPAAVRLEGTWVAWSGPPLALDVPDDDRVVSGQLVEAHGNATASPGLVRGDAVAGRIRATRVEIVGSSAGPVFWVGNQVRHRVRDVLGTDGPEFALLSGFLIGDVSRMSESDLEALRRSGLTHFVAVSGSNVGLFLAGWWIVVAPLGVGSRRRAVLGVAGLAVFVVATRWEASVVRAAVMAGLVLLGAARGLALDAWVALGAAVTLLLLVSGQLASDVGFQLSVAATLGILVGAGMFARRRPRWLWATLGASIAAQGAVVPLLLLHFGVVPLLSPVANLLAAPMVTVATIVAAAGVLTGVEFVVAVAAIPAAGVLAVARLAAEWPQLGIAGALGLAVLGAGATRPGLRPFVAVAAAAALAWPILSQPGAPAHSTVTFLDVGQGDAVLIREASGAVALVDGGRDPGRLSDAIRRYGVRRVDLLVVTHGDDDHAGGLRGIFGRIAVGRLWVPEHPNHGTVLEELVAEAGDLGIPVDRVDAGFRTRIGSVPVEAVGPQRRYQSQNDGSIVLWLPGDRSVLLTGDIEAVAQNELPDLSPDVMLVPHHGSATSDLDWLARIRPETAVVSVGENTYGHPAPEVMEVLRASGAEVHVTRDHGDLSVPIDSD
jgi:competence protein ComEC